MHKANSQKKKKRKVICKVGKLRFWHLLLPSFISFLSDAFSLSSYATRFSLCPQILLYRKDMMKCFILKKMQN